MCMCIIEDSKLLFHNHDVVFLTMKLTNINPTSKNQVFDCFSAQEYVVCGMWYVVCGQHITSTGQTQRNRTSRMTKSQKMHTDRERERERKREKERERKRLIIENKIEKDIVVQCSPLIGRDKDRDRERER